MDWQNAVVALVSAGLGGFIGVKMTVTRLQTQMEVVLQRVKELGDRSHTHNDALLRLDGRVIVLERKREHQR